MKNNQNNTSNTLNALDCVSRQAVLDYIDNMPSELTADGRRMIRRIRLTEYIQDSLPSVQPVIRCKDCKFHGYNECFHKLELIAAFDNNFCSYAEIKEGEVDRGV